MNQNQQDRRQREYQEFLKAEGIADTGGLWKVWCAAYERGMSAGVWSEQSSRRGMERDR